MESGGTSAKPSGSEEDHPSTGTTLIDPVGYSTNQPPSNRPVRIFAHGVFDLFHTGHVQFFEVVKTIFPDTHVIVGVTTDPDTIRVKGLTVISAEDRAQVVRGCKYVDEVIQDCEPVLTPEFMDEYCIDYFAHADTNEPDPYRFIKEQGKFLVIPRVKEWGSTTQIISRVIRNRDEYVLRQLKNGASRADMKISWLKLQWIKLRSR
ncbi:uncharacterized protein GGS22DRAFT_115532 [Annulohypoxylon maeteangense]|uniref:uncharacterized protein n=1 Tax=Annulohypoxylon maeteangense TaxID=1927788 RepID=UPI002008DA6D|nr:uncharacterized protein GGS22DRAFT_115532 [Annulohypoxylon maeteangense]KAI0886602.1 hypothetical protein GGS22DRAFT_115532 [Annulohypoxylon maeteangense]